MQQDTIGAASSQKISSIPFLKELDDETASMISGGRMKLETVRNPGLSTQDGDPVTVYVDGVKVNSVSTGYYP